MAAQTHATHTSPSLPLHGTSGYSTGQLTPVTSVESTQRVVENSQPPPMPESSLPCLPLQAAQLRGPKPSSYRPAVLRPTERPYRPSPLTPPQSSSNSLDSMPGTESPRPRSKQSAAGGLGRSVTAGAARDEHVRPYSPYSFAKVTAPPTREHWKPDTDAPSCDAAICNKPFTLFERRHHCRRCGNVFCAAHSPFSVPLDQDAQFHPDGVPSRACDPCWSDYKGWEATRWSRANNSALRQDMDAPATPSTPTMPSTSVKGGRDLGGMGHNAQVAGSVAGSVPRDWAWSTF